MLRRVLTPLLFLSALAIAPSAHAANAAANVDETQCAGVATWVKTGEGVLGNGRPYGDFRVSFPAPTAACSGYYAGANTQGGLGHGGQPVDSGPYTMYLHCVSAVVQQWQVPYNCSNGYSLAGQMEWASGATALYDVDDYWTAGGAVVTFGNRILPTGSGPFFPGRWTTAFTLTGDYAQLRTY